MHTASLTSNLPQYPLAPLKPLHFTFTECVQNPIHLFLKLTSLLEKTAHNVLYFAIYITHKTFHPTNPLVYLMTLGAIKIY